MYCVKKSKPNWKIQITHLKDRNHVYKIHSKLGVISLDLKVLVQATRTWNHPLDSSYKRGSKARNQTMNTAKPGKISENIDGFRYESA